MRRGSRVETVIADESERRELAEVVEALRDGATANLVAADGHSVHLPKSLLELVQQAATGLAQGHGMTLMPTSAEVTTQEAADILNISRPYLIRLLERGTLPFTMTGSHRRLRLEDVLGYKTQRDREREQSLQELTQVSQELGLYEDD